MRADEASRRREQGCKFHTWSEGVRAADTVANGAGIICFSHIFIPVYTHQSSPLMTRMSKEKKKIVLFHLNGQRCAWCWSMCRERNNYSGNVRNKAWREWLPQWGNDQHVSSRGKQRQPHPRHTGKQGKNIRKSPAKQISLSLFVARCSVPQIQSRFVVSFGGKKQLE